MMVSVSVMRPGESILRSNASPPIGAGNLAGETLMKTAIQGTFTALALMGLMTTPASAQDGLVPQWLFDGDDAATELADWSAQNQLTQELAEVTDGGGATRGVLKVESTGPDPYMFQGWEWNSVNYDPFPGDTYDVLAMSVRINQAATWQVYYITVADGGWGETMRQNFDIPAGDDFQDIEVELERGGWQEGDVSVFRIDPGTAAGVVTEIDYISFTGPPPTETAVDPQAKLATQWGRLRDSR